MPNPAQCSGKVERFASSSIFSKAEIDLTVFYVLALNANATITVVDPRFGFGDSQLLAMIDLEHPGEDWALTAEQDRLFVSVPAVNRATVTPW